MKLRKTLKRLRDIQSHLESLRSDLIEEKEKIEVQLEDLGDELAIISQTIAVIECMQSDPEWYSLKED